ncbi:hypothetical protein [Streptomyces cacaoi]|uniref:hypothetical protein n=1 Tax=Streptomyces cacaoi TaxID=1898 RepID=UPI002603A4D1|nr:hypothetical protein [Streptomyces cacaoi]
MHQPHQRASRLRVVTLASTVALAAALPLAAAVAGEDARLASEVAQLRAEREHPSPSAAADRSGRDERKDGPGQGRSSGDAGEQRRGGAHGRDGGFVGHARPVGTCGPEIASSSGVKVQTCVVTGEDGSWARTYYTNPSHRALPAVLTLTRPGGTTTRVHCTLRPGAERGTCETPGAPRAGGREGSREDGRQRSAGPEDGRRGPYAMVEVASADGARKVLRAGSN